MIHTAFNIDLSKELHDELLDSARLAHKLPGDLINEIIVEWLNERKSGREGLKVPLGYTF